MLVRYTVSLAGVYFCYTANEKDANGNFVYYEVDEAEAGRLIEANYAIAKETKPKKTKE